MEDHFGIGNNYEQSQQDQQMSQQEQQLQQQLQSRKKSSRATNQKGRSTNMIGQQNIASPEQQKGKSSDSSRLPNQMCKKVMKQKSTSKSITNGSKSLNMRSMFDTDLKNIQIKIGQPGEQEVQNIWNETMLKLRNDKEKLIPRRNANPQHVLFYRNFEIQLNQIKIDFEQNKERTQDTIYKLNLLTIEMLRAPKELRINQLVQPIGELPIDHLDQQPVFSPPRNDDDTEEILHILMNEWGKIEPQQ